MSAPMMTASQLIVPMSSVTNPSSRARLAGAIPERNLDGQVKPAGD
jgi:hypothetical protein